MTQNSKFSWLYCLMWYATAMITAVPISQEELVLLIFVWKNYCTRLSWGLP